MRHILIALFDPLFIGTASQRRDKLFLASQYLLNRPFQICQPHLYVTAKHMTSMKLIVYAAVFSFLFIHSQYIHLYIHSTVYLTVFIHELWQNIGDKNFITFFCYIILNKPFRIE